MHKKTSRNVEPIVLFILVVITVMEFLIYVGGVATGNILLALNSMIGLMLFGAALMITTILIRIYELILYFIDHYMNSSEERAIKQQISPAQSKPSPRKTTKRKTKKPASKRKKK